MVTPPSFFCLGQLATDLEVLPQDLAVSRINIRVSSPSRTCPFDGTSCIDIASGPSGGGLCDAYCKHASSNVASFTDTMVFLFVDSVPVSGMLAF